MRNITAMLAAAGLLLGAACDESTEETTEEAPATADNPPAEGEGAEPAEAEAEEPAAEAETAEAPAAEGEQVGFQQLVDGFAASQDDWMGKQVTLTAHYMNATSANGQIQNISLVRGRDNTDPTVLCTFAEAPESVDHLTQYDEVTVTGTVDEFFDRAALADCSLVE